MCFKKAKRVISTFFTLRAVQGHIIGQWNLALDDPQAAFIPALLTWTSWQLVVEITFQFVFQENLREFATEPPAKRMQEQEPLACKSACCSRGTVERMFCAEGLRAARKLPAARYAKRLTEVVRPRWPEGKCDENSPQ